jgi:hypothetical protein
VPPNSPADCERTQCPGRQTISTPSRREESWKTRTTTYTDGIHELIETFGSLDGTDVGENDEAVRVMRERWFLTAAHFDQEIKRDSNPRFGLEREKEADPPDK